MVLQSLSTFGQTWFYCCKLATLKLICTSATSNLYSTYVYIIVLHAVERSSFILMQFPWGVDETNHKGGLVFGSHKNKDRQICIHSFQA